MWGNVSLVSRKRSNERYVRTRTKQRADPTSTPATDPGSLEWFMPFVDLFRELSLFLSFNDTSSFRVLWRCMLIRERLEIKINWKRGRASVDNLQISSRRKLCEFRFPVRGSCRIFRMVSVKKFYLRGNNACVHVFLFSNSIARIARRNT